MRQIAVGGWVPNICVNGGLWHPSKVTKNSESDEDKEDVSDTLEELD